jgi:iron complex transport system ATP-binding protein
MNQPLIEARQLRVSIGDKAIIDRLNLGVASGERWPSSAATAPASRPCCPPWPACASRPVAPCCSRARTPPCCIRGSAAPGLAGPVPERSFGSTVLETALTGRHPHLGRWDWESTRDAELARGALRAVGLAGMEERQIHTLSGGERQRLAIATLLTQAAPLYLLDEPLSHLDLNHQMAVLELFAGTARDCGAGVIMVLHDPALAHRFCDRALLVYGDGQTRLGRSTTS